MNTSKKVHRYWLRVALKFEQWQADDGTNRNRLKVRLQRFEFVGVNPNGDGNQQSGNSDKPQTTSQPQ